MSPRLGVNRPAGEIPGMNELGAGLRRTAAAERLGRLRDELARRGLDGLLLPMADEHQNEYVPPRAQRIAWLTGFTGSAGLVVVLADAAALFTDGRYTLQARAQVDGSLFELRHVVDEPPTDWIAQRLGARQLGYDPWLFTADGVARFRAAAEKAGGALVPVDGNPLDAVWTDQPPPPLAPVVPHELRYAGESAGDKRARIAASLEADAVVLTATDSIAWLFNIRGGDVAHTPLALAFAILRADATADLFLDRRKLTPGLEAHLGNAIAVREQAEFAAALAELAGKAVRVDPASAASWVFDRLEAAGARIVRAVDPCQLPKACKNEVELAGARAAHRRDGAALTRFLRWLAAEGWGADELQAAARLRDTSFDTISGAGPNGAIVHYRSTPQTNRRLESGSFYLVDSGGQYLDGTTDVTRTIAIGAPSDEMRDRFTRVLKGHIALATCRFPEGVSGSQLDALARLALWRAGLDYDHGTGHGVGSYLGVHEGPQRISKLPSTVALKPGMIVSNEPGYYKAGAYGVRIENLVVVTRVEIEGAERPMLGFETLTRAPIDLNAVAPELLSAEERGWLNAYHAEVRAALRPALDADEAAWLDRATRAI
jgi:Xaa-Pro aminopeptidase